MDPQTHSLYCEKYTANRTVISRHINCAVNSTFDPRISIYTVIVEWICIHTVCTMKNMADNNVFILK
jgi:hypothetical protein